jgi:putative endonuclease
VWVNKRRFGEEAERLAEAFLERSNYRILERNYRCHYGEIDLIAEEKGTLVFVEVKARRSKVYGLPYEAVTNRKIKKLVQVALHYLQTHRLYGKVPVRFDVVSLELYRDEPVIEIIKGAFHLE